MLCDFHRAKSIPIMALWSSGMIPPSGKTLVKCSKHGGGPDFDYRQSPFIFCQMGVLYYYSDSSAVYIFCVLHSTASPFAVKVPTNSAHFFAPGRNSAIFQQHHLSRHPGSFHHPFQIRL